MKKRKLEIAPPKTEEVLPTKKRKIAEIRFKVHGTKIAPGKCQKQLGVFLIVFPNSSVFPKTKFTFKKQKLRSPLV